MRYYTKIAAVRRQLGCLRRGAGSGSGGVDGAIVIACNATRLLIRIAFGAALFVLSRFEVPSALRNKKRSRLRIDGCGRREGRGSVRSSSDPMIAVPTLPSSSPARTGAAPPPPATAGPPVACQMCPSCLRGAPLPPYLLSTVHVEFRRVNQISLRLKKKTYVSPIVFDNTLSFMLHHVAGCLD